MLVFETINDLIAQLAPGALEYATVLGYHTLGDGGGGEFYYDTSSVQDEEAGVIIKPSSLSATSAGRWIGIFENEEYNFKRLGAIADNSTDCHPILQSFLNNRVQGNTAGRSDTFTIIFPSGVYYCSDTIVVDNQVVYFRGESSTEFQFPAGKTGLRVTSHNGPFYSFFEKLILVARSQDPTDGKDVNNNKSTDNNDYKYRGCEVFAVSTFRDCTFNQFSGHGLVVYGALSATSSLNASLSRFENIKVGSNGGHGVWVVGPDANQIHFTQVDSRDNGRFGIYDQSFLGNMWYTCHTNNNAEGPYWCQLPTTQSTFENCYSEMYDPNYNSDGTFTKPSRLDGSPAIVIGGLHGAGIVGGTILSSGHLTPTFFGNGLQVGNNVIHFHLPGDDYNSHWRLGDLSGEGAYYGQTTTNAITLSPSLFEGDSMNFLRPDSYYYGRTAFQHIVALKKLLLGNRVFMHVNATSDLASVSATKFQVFAGDHFFNNNYDGTNPEGWICRTPGTYGTLTGVTAEKNGPTLRFTSIADLQLGDSVQWNGGTYQLTYPAPGGDSFYTTPYPGGTDLIYYPVSFATPVYKAFGSGSGATAQRPTTLTASDAGWQYFDTDLTQMVTWSGTAWI